MLLVTMFATKEYDSALYIDDSVYCLATSNSYTYTSFTHAYCTTTPNHESYAKALQQHHVFFNDICCRCNIIYSNNIIRQYEINISNSITVSNTDTKNDATIHISVSGFWIRSEVIDINTTYNDDTFVNYVRQKILDN